MLCAGVNAQCHALLRFTGGDSKLNRERRSTPHHGLACLEQMPRLCRRARHQGPTAHVQNKYFQSISFADTRRFRLHGPKAGLTSFANVGRGLVPATPLLPLGAFNHRPQSVELGCTSHGAYIFPTNVAPLERGELRLVNKGSFKPLPFRQGLLTLVVRWFPLRGVGAVLQDTQEAVPYRRHSIGVAQTTRPSSPGRAGLCMRAAEEEKRPRRMRTRGALSQISS